ncbi:MAG: nucleotide exchange factor GrpE [Solirubrobacterales bacterium]|nr:nucleotide exchange factor GrpE [Solirubrobacterales bacterium]
METPDPEVVSETTSGSDAEAPEPTEEPPPLTLEGEEEPELPAEAPPEASDKAAEYLALAQRTKADFDNFRKRAARDAAAAKERGTAKLAKELLPALDNLERAISHAAEEDPLLEGIKLVHTELVAALTRSGVEAFDPVGEPFDPNVHEAMAQVPKEDAATGTVVETYQQGYRLGESVIRPARVLVAA